MKGIKIIVLVIVLGVIIYGGVKLFKGQDKIEDFDFSKLEEIINATSTSPEVKIEKIENEGGLISYEGQDIADIGNDDFINKVSKEQVEKYKAELVRLKGVLEENPMNVDGWIGVGMIKKFFNNYEGARDAWEYAKYLNDDNSVNYYNLGNLYSENLKDYQMAETNFLKALEIGRKEVSYYIAVADFYRNFYIEKRGEAKKILENGIKEVPNDISLLSYAAEYYKKEGNKERALELYKKVLEFGPDNEMIKEEINNLEK